LATPIPRMFFLDGDLHKKLSVIISENILVAWNYPREERSHYNYQQARRRFQSAFDIKEVAELLEQPLVKLKTLVRNNILSRGSGGSYAIANRRPGTVYWSEDDLLNMRSEMFAIAKKNKYGEPYAGFTLISEAELAHKIRGGESYYVKNKNGDFVKVWRAI
jgi:hypothetical protein